MKQVKKAWNICTSLLVAAAVVLALLLSGVRLLGYRVFSVLSGSMEPAYHIGSLIYVKPTDYRELEVGDPISFMLDEKTVATHRIVEIVPDANDPETLRFRTKGDANSEPDGTLIHYKNVIGKVVFTIPKLGFFSDFIQHPPGLYLAIAVGALLLLLLFLPELISAFREEDAPPERRKKKGQPAAGEKAEASSARRAERGTPPGEKREDRPGEPKRSTPHAPSHSSPKRGGAHGLPGGSRFGGGHSKGKHAR